MDETVELEVMPLELARRWNWTIRFRRFSCGGTSSHGNQNRSSYERCRAGKPEGRGTNRHGHRLQRPERGHKSVGCIDNSPKPEIRNPERNSKFEARNQNSPTISGLVKSS